MDNCLPAVYRTVDPIDNLLVKVSICKRVNDVGNLNARQFQPSIQAAVGIAAQQAGLQSSFGATGAFGGTGGAIAAAGSANVLASTSLSVGGGPGAGTAAIAGIENDRAEHIAEFAWQQKVFGPRELLLYAHAAAERAGGKKGPIYCDGLVDCGNPVVRDYVDQIERQLQQDEPLFDIHSSVLLYTYVDRDGYLPPGEKQRSYMDTRLASGGPVVLPGGAAGGSNRPGPAGQDAAIPGQQPAQSQLPVAGSLLNPTEAAARALTSTADLIRRGAAGLVQNLQNAQSYGGGYDNGGDSVPPSSLTGAVLDPLADPRGVAAHAFKENPYSTMYVMAAVGIDKEGFRSRNINTAMTEICLGSIRSHTTSTLLEMRPGFGEPVPYGRHALVTLTRTIQGEAPQSGIAAAQALISADAKLGQGKYGGVLRLRPLPGQDLDAMSGATAAAGRRGSSHAAQPPVAPESSSAILAYAVETHRFALPDGSAYDYTITNPDEDIESVLSAQGQGQDNISGYGARGRGASSTAAAMLRDGDFDVLASIRAEEVRSIQRQQHRVGSDFHSVIPRPLSQHPRSFRLTCYVEIVAAARFDGPRAVYIAYELTLPKGSGWRLISPGSDTGSSSASPRGNGGVGGGGRTARQPLQLNDYAGVNEYSNGAAPDGGNGHYYGPNDEDYADDWDRDPYLEAAEQADAEAAQQHQLESDNSGADAGEGQPLLDADASAGVTGLRRRHGAGPNSAAAAAQQATAGTAVDPQKRSPRRWLRTGAVAGVTQVARFVNRPWSFGSEGASLPSGVSSSQNSKNSADSAADPFFSPAGSDPSGSSGGGAGPGSHPFGFGEATSQSIPGFQRGCGAGGGYATSNLTNRGTSRSCGAGSVSLVSSFNNESFGSAGSVSCTAPPAGSSSAFELLAVPGSSKVPVAHVSYPIEVHLLCDAASCINPAGPSQPTLFFSVFSRDSWDRHRSEGYSYLDLPLKPGCADHNVSCWKPKGDVQQEESDFFLGGSTRLADVTYARIPSDFSGGHDGYGMRPRTLAADDGDADTGSAAPAGPAVPNAAAGVALGSDPQPNVASQLPLPAPPSMANGGVGVADAVRRAQASIQNRNSLSRYGFVSVTTGEIGLRTNTLVQMSPAALQEIAEARRAASGIASVAQSSSTAAGNSRWGVATKAVRAALTVDQIIAEAKALRKKDRDMRESRGERGPSASPPVPGKVDRGR